MNVSSVTGDGRGGGRGEGIFGYGRGGGGIFGYVRGRGGSGGRGDHGGCGGRGGGRGGRVDNNIYNNNKRKNHNHGVDTSDLTKKFTSEEVSVLIQANVWDDIRAEQRANRRRLNNNNDVGDITSRVNARLLKLCKKLLVE